MEGMGFMASVRPRLRLSPTPSDRLLMASLLPMPMPPGIPTMLATPATSLMAMEVMEAMEAMAMLVPTLDKF